MRKIFAVMLTVALALTAVPAVFAQDDMEPTIAEIVIASTEAETPEFTVLLSAVQAADPSILELLNTPTELNGYTVFAPTDAAFTALLEELGMSAEDVLGNQELVNTLLSYHVVPAEFSAEVVTALPDGTYLGTLLADAPLQLSLADGAAVNSSNIVDTDIMASNGIVHVIDAVLVPPAAVDMISGETMEEETTEEEMAEEEAMEEEEMGSVVDVASGNPDFETLVTAVNAVAEEAPGVVDILANGTITVFAPTNDAFAALPDGTLDTLLAAPADLAGVLAYHVVPGIVTSEGVAALTGMAEDGSFNVATAAGTALTITATEDGVTAGNANVVATDVMADNGVIHVVDAVILPPSE